MNKLIFDSSTISLLFSNLAIIVLSIIQKWEVSEVLWVYWMQSVIIGFFQFLRILSLKKFSTENFTINNKSVLPTPQTKIFTAFFFAFHYSFFHFIYAIFLFNLFTNKPLNFTYLFTGGLIFFLNHTFSYFRAREKSSSAYFHNKIIDGQKTQNIGQLMFSPYARIIPMHLVIIFGAILGQFTLVYFLLLKTLTDLGLHILKHKITTPKLISGQKGSIIPIILLIIAIPIAFSLGLNFSKLPNSPNLTPTPQKETVLTEKIIGSKFHSPDATWWGYNQSKIVRFEDIVFTYYIANEDDSNKTSSSFVIMKKHKDGAWEEGAKFPTSRPGNLLIDSLGGLHAFVFEPFDVKTNDSWGKILHYYFPNSSKGDIKNYEQEIIVDNDGKSETANIRVGAAIGVDDTMAVSFGLTKFNPLYKRSLKTSFESGAYKLVYKEQSEHIYFKKPSEQKWNHTYTDGLSHDYFYPFTLVSKNTFSLLPVQDDFAGQGNPNIYQKILFMQVQDGQWKQELVADLSNHELSKKRPRLLEQEDLYEDHEGNIHIIYKEFLDERNDYAATVHWHLTGKLGNFKKEAIKFEKNGINWVRLLEVDNKLYYFVTTFGEVYISPVGHIKLTKIDVPEDAKNSYPYISTKKSGSKEGKYIDILLLGADKKLFEEGQITNYYVRIPKDVFKSLK